jgi:hypothetical protein
MGAGDIYKYGEEFVDQLKSERIDEQEPNNTIKPRKNQWCCRLDCRYQC